MRLRRRPNAIPACLLASALAALFTASAATVSAGTLPDKKAQALPTGVTLAWFEMGNPAGETLLFLHGLTDSSRSFLPTMQYLTKLRPDLRLISLDLRGHGASSMPPGEACRSRPEDCFRPADFADDALAFMDALGIPQATLVGHSMGSVVSQEVALTHPERVRQLVLLGTTAGGFEKRALSDFLLGGLIEGAWKPALEAKGKRYPEDVYELTPLDADPEAEKWMAANWVTEALAAPELLAAIVPETGRVKLGTWIGATRAILGVDNRVRLGGLGVPVFIAWGSQDTLIPKPAQEALLAALDGAVRQGLTSYVWKQYGLRPPSESSPPDDVGHNLPWAVPEGLARDIAAYLSTGSPTTDLFYGAEPGGVATRPGEAVLVRSAPAAVPPSRAAIDNGPLAATPEALVAGIYDVVSFGPGAQADWDKVRSLFLPNAIVFLRTSREASTLFSVEGFVEDFVRFAARPEVQQNGFEERVVKMKTTVFRDIAQALVLYEARIPGQPRPPQQGIDSFQLVRQDGRWWIAAIVNDIVTAETPVPPELR